MYFLRKPCKKSPQLVFAIPTRKAGASSSSLFCCRDFLLDSFIILFIGGNVWIHQSPSPFSFLIFIPIKLISSILPQEYLSFFLGNHFLAWFRLQLSRGQGRERQRAVLNLLLCLLIF